MTADVETNPARFARLVVEEALALLAWTETDDEAVVAYLEDTK